MNVMGVWMGLIYVLCVLELHLWKGLLDGQMTGIACVGKGIIMTMLFKNAKVIYFLFYFLFMLYCRV